MACQPAKFVAEGASPERVRDLALLPPAAFVSYVERGNQMTHSDSLSAITDSLFLAVTDRARHLPIDTTLAFDSLTRLRMLPELEAIMQRAALQKNRGEIGLPPVLDSLIESAGRRYGLALIGSGFGRRRGNYAGQSAKALGVGLLTLGMYVPVPYKSGLTVFAFVLDAEADRVVFVGRTGQLEKDPTTEEAVERQVVESMRGFYYPARRR